MSKPTEVIWMVVYFSHDYEGAEERLAKFQNVLIKFMTWMGPSSPFGFREWMEEFEGVNIKFQTQREEDSGAGSWPVQASL